MTSAKNSCSVCGEPLEPHTEAFCNACGLAYHLNQRIDLPGKDCGQVWISEEHLALEFACNLCLAGDSGQQGALDDVLDAAEAAMVAEMSEHALLQLAVSGMVRHRRTGSGVYLFERRDLLMLIEGRR